MEKRSRFAIILLMLMVSAMTAFNAWAAAEWHKPQSGQATNNMVEVRWGSASGEGDWEIGLRTSTGGFTPVVMRDYTWPNGEKVPFVLVYTPSTGNVSFSLNGTTVSHNYQQYAGNAIYDLHLVAKTSNNGHGDSWTCHIDDLVANGTAFEGGLTSLTSNGQGTQWMTGTIDGLTTVPGQTVTVEGTITFSWEGEAPHGNRMQVFFYLGEPYDPNAGQRVTLTSPNGGETWISGTKQNITWTSQNIKKIRIDLSTDGGETWTRIKNNTKGSEGSYEWNVDDVQSTNCLIRVENKDDPSVFDISDAPFTITIPPELALSSPVGGEAWTAGTQQAVTWTSRGLQTVAIEYSTDGTNWTMVDPAAPASQGTYLWTVPETPSENAYIRVSGFGISVQNSEPFSILPVPALTLTAPNGGEAWRAGSVQDITWTYANVSTVTLQYTVDGQNWIPIETSLGASASLYSWTLPSVPSETARVRIISNDSSALFDVSDADFAITPLPSITVLTPNGGEQWQAGETYTITWTSVEVDSVAVGYSIDGQNWTRIAEALPADQGSIEWNIPDTPTETCLVRVIDKNNAGVGDQSDAVFTILVVPTITLVSPNGGESWIAGTTRTITWSQNHVASVQLDYTVNGTDWTLIADQIDAASGTFDWTVPATPSAECRVRITSSSDPNVSDEGDAVFSIIPAPSITVIAPNGGESWITGAVETIQWTSTTVAAVNIEFSADGVSWSPVASEVPAASGAFDWTIPGTVTANGIIRISGVADPNVNDVGDAPFSIVEPSTISIISPNGGESIVAGSTSDITWNVTNVQTVSIEYSTDGTAWTVIAETVQIPADETAGTYNWTVPDTPSAYCFVRITSASDPDVSDVSDAAFEIQPAPVVTVTSPNGGESWLTGTTQSITWTSVNVPAVTIEYTTDAVNSAWTTVAQNVTAQDGSYSWTLPDVQSEGYLVRVSSSDAPGVSDTSDTPFSVSFPSSITVISPNGGEFWESGTQQAITWTSVNVSTVTISYYDKNSSPTVIATNVDASLGTYTWTLPNRTIPSLFVGVASTEDPENVFDLSDASFTITLAPRISIQSPNGGEVWTAGSTRMITWTSSTVTDLMIEYSTDGDNWTTIVSSVSAALGSYEWTVPEIESTGCVVRISSNDVPGINDVSDAPFIVTFAPSITITSPNGGEAWIAGTQHDITWTSTNVASVNIEYSTEDQTWTQIAAGLDAGTGAYTWTVPDTPTSYSSIRITSVDNAEIYDVSDDSFAILPPPSIIVVSPNGGENWTAGTTRNITWTSVSVGSVKLEYTTDGETWTSITNDTSAATGAYAWTLPDIESATFLVRVTANDVPNVSDTSDAAFNVTFAPTITLAAPNGGEQWTAGTVHDVTWTSTNVANVRIEFFTGSGMWTLVADNIDASLGTYAWTVPDVESVMCQVRISDTTNSDVRDVSDGTFTVSGQPVVTVTSPNGGESWMVGTTQTITWTSSNVTAVTIEQTTDGTTWTAIAQSADASGGSYAWTVPAAPSVNCLIRISDAVNPTVTDTSDAPFAITAIPAVTLSSPNGGESWTVGSKQNITWTSASIGNVTIEFSPDGDTWTTVAANYPAASGTYLWTVPNAVSDAAVIRITRSNASEPTDTSDAPFSIVPVPAITLVSPNGGEEWTVGEEHAVTWTSVGVTMVAIEFSTDGTNWTTVAESLTAASGTYLWTVPAVAAETCTIRISNADDPGLSDTSDAPFTISPAPAVLVTSPNGGEVWIAGEKRAVTWTSIGVTQVNIDFSANGTDWTPVAENIPAASGSYLWTIPAEEAETCIIRIANANDTDLNDTSDEPFAIEPPPPLPSIIVTSPNGGENWVTGTDQTITWTSVSVASVRIEYSTTGVFWAVIADNVDASLGAYEWTVPDTPSVTSRIKITSVQNPFVFDLSNSVFSIVAASRVTVLAPNGGESWTGGRVHFIRWTSINVSSVKIELSLNGGTTWSTIVPNYPAASGSYSWTVPNMNSTTCLIRVTDSTNPTATDTSDAAFTLLPTPPEPIITVIAPDGGEVWSVGTQQNITWTSTNVVNVKIEYTTDGNIWTLIAQNVPAFTGSFLWTIPNSPSEFCSVRIVSMADENVKDTSNASFTITPPASIIVGSPNGGEIWQAETTKTIRWSVSNVFLVKILYSIDNGPWQTITENFTASEGFFEWVVPNTPSFACLVRVEDMNDPNVADVSNSFFRIVPPPTPNIINLATGTFYETLDVAVAEVQAGQTLEFRRAGVYVSRNIEIAHQNVTLQTAPGIDVRLDATYDMYCLKVSGNGCSVNNLTISNSRQHGIWVTGDNVTINGISTSVYVNDSGIFGDGADYLTVINSSIRDVGNAGIRISNSSHVNVMTVVTPTNNAIKNVILVEQSDDVSLSNMTIGSDWQDDIVIIGSSNVRVSNSTLKRARNAVYASDSSNITLTNIVTENIWNHSVHMNGCTNSTIEGGTISGDGVDVYFLNSNGMTVSNALLTSSRQAASGLVAHNSPNTTVTGTTVEKMWSNGISIENSPDCHIDHCIVSQTRYGVYVGEISHRTTVVNNTIVNNNSSGIFISGAVENVLVKNNIIVKNGWSYWTWGIQCQNTNNPGLDIKYNNVWNNRENYKNCVPGEGEISTDPLFVAQFTDVHLQPGSPSVDAGDPTDPVGMEPVPNGGIIDQGAYGGTPEATPTSMQILSVADAASNGWMSLYCHPWDGMQYSNISALSQDEISPWMGFWVLVNRNIDVLFPPDPTEGDAPQEMTLTVDPERYYLISTPLQPENPDINAVFGDDLGDGLHDGSPWQIWRTSKYDYLTETYTRYSGPGSLDTILAGRGYWMYHVYPIPMYLTVSGTPVQQNSFTEFKLPSANTEGTFHMLGNPFHYAVKWRDVKVRTPMTETLPLGKISGLSLPDDEEAIDTWRIDLSVSDPTGTFYDNDNRAGVVDSGDDFSGVLSTVDLAPITTEYVRLVLRNPNDRMETNYSYSYQSPGRNEYVWDVVMTTSFGAIDAHLDVVGVEEIPSNFTVKLVAPDGTMTELIEDTTVSVRLSNFGSENYKLVVSRSDIVKVDDEKPKAFAITGVSPNPFNPSTTLNFTLNDNGNVRARVYNMNGQVVTTLINGYMNAGNHSFVWTPDNLGSGVYIISVETRGMRETAKVTLLK